MTNKDSDNFIFVAVITTSGAYPQEGFDRTPAHQPVRIQLERAARELNIADTSGWVAQVAGRTIDPNKNYIENGLTGEVTIDFFRPEGGGGTS
ncbi:MAG: hypothetical protein HYS27_04920 [Deltaproteobacteria bacterium]|nr:hypothetical protein [Deltaproteobacteria bacterium]